MTTWVTHVEGARVTVVAFRVQITTPSDFCIGADLVDTRVGRTNVSVVTVVVDIAVTALIVFTEVPCRTIKFGTTATGL